MPAGRGHTGEDDAMNGLRTLLLWVICFGVLGAAAPPGRAGAAPGDAAFDRAREGLGLRLLQHLVDAEAPANVVVSPASLDAVLGLLWAGSTSAARAAIGALAWGDGTAAPPVPPAASGDPSVRLISASAVWADDGTDVFPAYVAFVRDRATLAVADLGAIEATEAINAWVRKNTEGMIGSIVERLPGDAALVLVNASISRASGCGRSTRRRLGTVPSRLPAGSASRSR